MRLLDDDDDDDDVYTLLDLGSARDWQCLMYILNRSLDN